MMDRVARNQAIEVMEAYLSDRMTAFEFDDRFGEIETDDATVSEVRDADWFHEISSFRGFRPSVVHRLRGWRIPRAMGVVVEGGILNTSIAKINGRFVRGFV